MSKILGAPIRVKTQDGQDLEIPEKITKCAGYFRKPEFIEERRKKPGEPHHLAHISYDVMMLILEYFDHHLRAGTLEEPDEPRERSRYFPFEPWDANFFLGDHKRMPVDMVIELCRASDFLEYPNLTHSCCRAIAYLIQGKKPEDVRKMFKLENDIPQKDEEEIRKEIFWAEEYEDQLRMRQ